MQCGSTQRCGCGKPEELLRKTTAYAYVYTRMHASISAYVHTRMLPNVVKLKLPAEESACLIGRPVWPSTKVLTSTRTAPITEAFLAREVRLEVQAAASGRTYQPARCHLSVKCEDLDLGFKKMNCTVFPTAAAGEPGWAETEDIRHYEGARHLR